MAEPTLVRAQSLARVPNTQGLSQRERGLQAGRRPVARSRYQPSPGVPQRPAQGALLGEGAAALRMALPGELGTRRRYDARRRVVGLLRVARGWGNRVTPRLEGGERSPRLQRGGEFVVLGGFKAGSHKEYGITTGQQVRKGDKLGRVLGSYGMIHLETYAAEDRAA